MADHLVRSGRYPAVFSFSKVIEVDGFLIVDKATSALELEPEKTEQLAKEMYLFDQPDDPLELHDWNDLREVLTGMSPVRGINHFHYINPEFNLQKIIEAKPLDVLQAVLRIFTLSNRWLEQF